MLRALKPIRSSFGFLLLFFVTTSLFGAEDSIKEKVIVEKLLDFAKPIPRHLTFLPNTNQFFVYHLFQKQNAVYQWDLGRKKVLKTYDLGDGFICQNIKISPEGRFTLIVCDTEKDFSAKVLLVDNQRQTLVRSIPIREGDSC